MLLKLAACFFKVGCIGFGGGSALIPVIENEIVKKNKYITEKTYTEHTVVANITPGALPVKLGSLAGYEVCGIPGMLSCAAMVAFPGTFVTVMLLALVSQLGAGAVHQITFASVGISVFIIYLLLEYVKKVLSNPENADDLHFMIFLMLFSFAVTCGKELREFLFLFLGESALWSAAPILDIATVDLLKLAFFMIFFTGGHIKSPRMAITAVIAICYLFLFGKGSPFSSPEAKLCIQLVMLALSVFFLIYDSKRNASKAQKSPDWKSLLRQLSAWGLLIAVCCAPVFFVFSEPFAFLRDGALSAVTSFGGGEAYLSVADGMFVATGQIASTEFYGQLVPIANALPGPILVKILSGMGYMMGFAQNGFAAGLAVAFAGFGIAIGATSMVCVVVNFIYTCFTDLSTFRVLKQWILPVICGLLLSVILSMLCEMLKVTGETGVNGIVSMLCCIFLFFAVRLLSHRFRLNDVLVIIILGGITVLTLNIL